MNHLRTWTFFQEHKSGIVLEVVGYLLGQVFRCTRFTGAVGSTLKKLCMLRSRIGVIACITS